jgi:hypothetical protein
MACCGSAMDLVETELALSRRGETQQAVSLRFVEGIPMTDEEKKEKDDNRNAIIFIIAGLIIIAALLLGAFLIPVLSLAGWE